MNFEIFYMLDLQIFAHFSCDCEYFSIYYLQFILQFNSLKLNYVLNIVLFLYFYYFT